LIWPIYPAAVILVIIPLYLIYMTLQVPNLQRQTEIDPKTQLFNARYFAEALKKEYERALRFDRPLTVVIGDLDLLRNINNTYGHLAGDVILVGVAEILQNNFREYDLVARFGGEEFAILMPETTPEEAFPRVEAIRQAIAEAEFEVSTSVTPIKATVSFGIAARNGEKSPEELVHNADVTLYRSKLMGRNVTCIYSYENIDELFKGLELEEAELGEVSLEGRLPATKYISQPNPLREAPNQEHNPPRQKSLPKQETKSPLLRVYGFIVLLATLAVSLSLVVLPISPIPEWFGLFAFSLIILISEGLSLDLYVNDTTVSTSAAPLIAGALLFGPIGTLVLSLVLAGTAMIIHRSQLHRFIFNSANHYLSAFLGTFLVLLFREPFISLPGHTQVAFSILSGNILFFCSTFLLAAVMSISIGQSWREIWNERFRWLWPYYIAFGVVAFALILGYSFAGVLGVLAVLVPLLMLRFSHLQYINRTKEMVSQLHSKNTELEDHTNRITTLNEEILLSLAHVIDLRDSYTLGHSRCVSDYAVQIAKEVGLPEECLDLIRTGSLLHDIGKIGIPDSILYKPSSLTCDEFEFIRQHPGRGADLVHTNKSLQNIAPLIRHHHERFDGRGYPDGLSGHEIPVEARILCLADSVQAMESDRPYRKALSRSEILAEVEKHTGSQFDPQVVKAFLRIFNEKLSDPIIDLPQGTNAFEPAFSFVENGHQQPLNLQSEH
jgi:diguanylate cyclase (GGDEF)-like protein/putative nucleotidyltransferase with HDIG domain